MSIRLLTPDEVAEQLRVTRAEVQRMARAREIEAIKVGRFWRFEPKAVEAFVKKARVAA